MEPVSECPEPNTARVPRQLTEARLFPISLNEVPSWAAVHGATQDEARRRFAQLVIIESIAQGVPGQLSFKGGNALRFCYHNPRGTTDIDYTALNDFPDNPEAIRELLDAALRKYSPDYGIACKVQSVQRNPPKPEATKPTYQVSVGWAFPGFRDFPGFLESKKPSPATTPVEISLNDVVCESVVASLHDATHAGITVCTLEDIIAEKLRALLQQVSRNRTRPQDVYDIARIVRSEQIDEQKVATYFIEKCRNRDVSAAKSSFSGEVRQRAEADYDGRIASTGAQFIPFDEAWVIVKSFVDGLNIPD